jgi:hypothetical protein
MFEKRKYSISWPLSSPSKSIESINPSVIEGIDGGCLSVAYPVHAYPQDRCLGSYEVHLSTEREARAVS